MAERYEIGIAGIIGPIIADGLPELSIITATRWTRLVGTVDGPDGLRRLLDLLSAHGLPAVNIRLAQRSQAAAGPASLIPGVAEPR